MRFGNQTSTSRAEQLRQQREKSTQKRMDRVSDHAQRRVYQAPPVVARGLSMGPSVATRASSRPRRKYSVALGASGAELLLPSVPVVRPGWRLLSALLVLLLGAATLFVMTSESYRVDAITVQGLKRITPADLEKELQLVGSAIYTLDPQQLKADVEKKFPELTAVSVAVTLPNQVTITAKERKPVLAWTYDKTTLWIDKEGVVFQPRGDVGNLLTISADGQPPVTVLPEVTATPQPGDQAVVKADDILDGKHLVDASLVNAATLLNKQVTSVKKKLVYTSSDGLGWTDEGGWKVFVGVRLDNLDQKLLVYNAIVKKLKADGVKPDMISVEHVHAPFYRLER